MPQVILTNLDPVHIEDFPHGKIKLQENKLVVDLGQSHGVSINSLAVSSGTNTAYSILHVTEIFPNQAVIEPLNKSLELSSLIGKTINFMGSN